MQTGFEDRVLPVTLPVAAAWGRQQYAQPDGKILAVGTSQNVADVTELALARYLSHLPAPGW